MGSSIIYTISKNVSCVSSNCSSIASHKPSISLSFLSVSRKSPDFTATLIKKRRSLSAFQFPSVNSVEASSSRMVGANDLLIVGPGVLGRLVAEKWKAEHPACEIVGQTVTTDHHAELIEMGINPSLKGTSLGQKFPYVIFCAPPSRSPDYSGDVREAASNWSGEGSFLFTSSSAPYDCNDNGSCDEDTPVVPIGRSPRTDILLKAEKVVLECGGCVLRLAGLYIS